MLSRDSSGGRWNKNEPASWLVLDGATPLTTQSSFAECTKFSGVYHSQEANDFLIIEQVGCERITLLRNQGAPVKGANFWVYQSTPQAENGTMNVNGLIMYSGSQFFNKHYFGMAGVSMEMKSKNIGSFSTVYKLGENGELVSIASEGSAQKMDAYSRY